jgi:hypothetical protein
MSKNKIYKGIIVQESLDDSSILKSAQILTTQKTPRGNVHTVLISKNQIDALPEYMKKGSYYAHFWHGSEILVVFKEETFKLVSNKPDTWEEAINQAIVSGIPEEEIDFVID